MNVISIPDENPEYLKYVHFSNLDVISYCNNCNDEFDIICTLYFIDTAQNFLDYIDCLKKILKKNGLWINIGPLHWMMDQYQSFHLSFDEVMDCLEQSDFIIERKEIINECSYVPSENSTFPLTYKNCFFVVRKQ